jgi:lipid A 3-O-deacylase
MNRFAILLGATLLGAGLTLSASAQSLSNVSAGANAAAHSAVNLDTASSVLHSDPWEYGVFFQGGVGTATRTDVSLLSGGFRVGKVITDEHLKGVFRGQFEYLGEVLPYWQAFTPKAGTQAYTVTTNGQTQTSYLPTAGGTYTGFSITPIILRWDFKPHKRFAPWIQGAGGLIYTTHKFPPTILVPHGTPGGTSVFNFTPQFGVGFHYFVKPRQSINFAANAIHISSASLGDTNPGVNATVQFQIGYTWWR